MKKFKLILKILAVVFAVIFAVVVGCGLYLGLVGHREYKASLNECPLEQKINEIRSNEHYTPLSELPDIYIDAVIAAEDHNYYNHGAVSIVSTVRAMLANLRSGDYSQGGSTITQQLAKNLYFTQEKKLTRKVAEMFMAVELEKHYTKDEILELYVNCIYYGGGYYNIYDAAMGYYGVPPSQLTDYQATLIAGLPNAPSVYSPDNNSPLTSQRHKQVLNEMVKYGYIDQDRAEKILEQGE